MGKTKPAPGKFTAFVNQKLISARVKILGRKDIEVLVVL
jgi:hypothetical protein